MPSISSPVSVEFFPNDSVKENRFDLPITPRHAKAVQNQGKVYLVGAGTGDPELLTIKAYKTILQADVICYDNLVSDEILALNTTAEKIYVGKKCHKHSMSQQDINGLLVTLAQQGKTIVRLKSGDPFIFGRGGEEMQTVISAGVACESIAGITTALAVANSVNIPLTHRDQLPDIWERLINAGFETGHAYGKSLRTVKSCVGSTWCRYGVDDSVGLAIKLENRYKGLRSPHKIKFGVSGCTRECAEAQGKDIGIIATENGWNLYVCGNGGMRPRHAELFASDLDKATLIKYIDRFLMFYIKTGDRLQRTSVWREKMEGGLEYIQDVVINDSLGIAEELEAQMQADIDAYQCEWKTTLSDPERLKRFKHFINSDKVDDNVVFVEERSQIRPATADEKSVIGQDATEFSDQTASPA